MQGAVLSDEEQSKADGRLADPRGPASGSTNAARKEDAGEDRAARRAPRRQRARAQLDTSVPSPCITVCQIDPKDDICIGCRRSIDEIRDWPILSAEEKRAVLALLPGRRS